MDIICKICNNEYGSLLSLSKHLTNKHKYGGLAKYFVDFEDFKIPKCIICNGDAKYYRGLEFRKTCGSEECLCKLYASKKISDNVKNKISLKLKESHKKGNHPGWSFINNDINKRSYPEKWFIKNVLEKYELCLKYNIKEKMPFSKYFLDFAILDMKIDIEIDGKQHFATQKAIQHDKDRDNFLLKNDWKVYRLAWSELQKNSNVLIEDLLNFINGQKLYRKYDIEELKKQINKNISKYGSREKYFINVRMETFQKYEPLMEIIKNSNIDFSKYGWVKEASNLTNIKQQKINKWMKRYMEEFYNEKCFKRKKLNSYS